MIANLSGMVWRPMRRPMQFDPSIRAKMRNLPRTSLRSIFYGHIKNFRIYDRALSDEEMRKS